ncbi:MAG: ATP synthase F1 subunit delta [Candidatus Moranbacteria bacterium CG10_big_fil_rev_8_21_14_0_10_35_21]|nr:MAG: ATP synthase F1 subunit delta [Candidatus Moranbacteria bacterium CG10_big_fil_rev_8_21_14_0_10_35_21]PJA88883.1 MAG: ATP synthase F1 subunit delta [Candidatus Moranbacteria bacterium CG_4_9_14_3_um_filter_36_9]
MKITATQYAKTLYELTNEKSHEEIDGIVLNFAKFLVNARKAKMIPKIVEKFSEIYNKGNGIVEVEATTSRKLSGSQVIKLEEFIKEKYPPASLYEALRAGKIEKVEINNVINEKIQGGIIIRVGDEVMDGSVSAQLKNLKIQLAK